MLFKSKQILYHWCIVYDFRCGLYSNLFGLICSWTLQLDYFRTPSVWKAWTMKWSPAETHIAESFFLEKVSGNALLLFTKYGQREFNTEHDWLSCFLLIYFYHFIWPWMHQNIVSFLLNVNVSLKYIMNVYFVLTHFALPHPTFTLFLDGSNLSWSLSASCHVMLFVCE